MSSVNNMDKVRQNIFDTMDGLKNGTMDVPTAKAMSEAAQVLINSLKVEIDARKLTGSKELPAFVGDCELPSPAPAVTVRGLKVDIDQLIGKSAPPIDEPLEKSATLSADEEYLNSLLSRNHTPVHKPGVTGVTTHRMKDGR